MSPTRRPESLTCLQNEGRREGSKDGKKNEDEPTDTRERRNAGKQVLRARTSVDGERRERVSAGVLRVEKENRAKEGEADAFFAEM